MYMSVGSSTTCTCTCMLDYPLHVLYMYTPYINLHRSFMYTHIGSSTTCTCTCMLDYPLHVHVHQKIQIGVTHVSTCISMIVLYFFLVPETQLYSYLVFFIYLVSPYDLLHQLQTLNNYIFDKFLFPEDVFLYMIPSICEGEVQINIYMYICTHTCT